MKKHHTKCKGDIGVAKAIANLIDYDYLILTPTITEHAPFDIVTYKNNKFTRIQVKYRKLDSLGRIPINFRSTGQYTKMGTFNVPIDKNDVDIFCVYCPDTKKCYYFDPKQFNKAVNLRVKPPKRKTKLINMADDYAEPCF